MLKDKEILITINNRDVKYYKERGYNIKGKDTIKINIEDLKKNSHIKVKVKCDMCDNDKEIKYYNYSLNIEKNGIYICNNCKGRSIVQSNLINYGVRSTLELDYVKEKSKKTLLDKYGVDHYSKSDEFKDLIFNKLGVRSTFELDYVKEKSKKTLLDRYGVTHFSKSEEFKENKNKTCKEKFGVESYSKTEEFKEKIRLSVLSNLINKHQIEILDYKNNFITAECENGHKYVIHRHTLKNRLKYNTVICTICNPIGSTSSSGYENILLDFIKTNNQNILTNIRNIIPPNELDIYLPDLNLAFEFNGLWWHNELNKDNNYHLNKTEECEKLKIQLIHIWEDDWLYKLDIIKSMILNKLGKTINKIFARKTTIKEISNNKIVREFLDKNHIQGSIGSKIKLGLYYENELISLMTFGNHRVTLDKKSTNEGEYELLRFCNKLNTNVIGGVSKLFKYFINNYKPKEITTYVNRSYSQGKLYETLGFKFIGKTQPNYYYVIDGVRHPRFNFRKDKLVKEGFDSSKTEHEIMLERKIYRIYDSGNLKFIYP